MKTLYAAFFAEGEPA